MDQNWDFANIHVLIWKDKQSDQLITSLMTYKLLEVVSCFNLKGGSFCVSNWKIT